MRTMRPSSDPSLEPVAAELEPCTPARRKAAPLVAGQPRDQRLIGPISLDEATSQRTVRAVEGEIAISLAAGVVSVTDRPSGRTAAFALAANRNLMSMIKQQDQAGADVTQQTPLGLARSSGTLDAGLIIVRAWGQRDASGATKFNQAGFWVLIGKAAGPYGDRAHDLYRRAGFTRTSCRRARR